MSEARWCDIGGHAFSVADDDWESLVGTRMVRDEATGRRIPQQVQQDRCGDCIKKASRSFALASGPSQEPRADQETQADR